MIADGVPPARRVPLVDGVISAGLALVTGATSLFFMSEPVNDHFAHVVWARQMLEGSLPLADFDEPGMPLQVLLSAAMLGLVGDRLIGEALIVAGSFAITAVLLFVVVRRLSASRLMGVIAGLAPLILNPRTYGYPKLLVYAGAAYLVCRYIDRPDARSRVAAFAVWAAIGLLFRLDHGLYLAVIFTTVILCVHGWRGRRVAARQLATAAALGAVLLLPWLAWVQTSFGVTRYAEHALLFARAEAAKNAPLPDPHWPFTGWNDVVAFDAPLGVIGVQWADGTTPQQRAELATRFGLEPCCGDPNRYYVRRASLNQLDGLVRNPAVVDTAGIDRGRSEIASPWARFRAGTPGLSSEILPSLGTPENAAAFLYLVFWLVLILTLIVALLELRVNPHGFVTVLPLVVMAVLTGAGFLRAPLTIRVPDVLVVQFLLIGWLWGRLKQSRSGWRPLALTLTAVMLVAVIRAEFALGAARERFEWVLSGPEQQRSERWREARERLLVSPPGASIRGDRALPLLLAYLQTCTRSDEPVLVTWFGPELYFYSSRRFAGRLAYYSPGFWDLPENETANLERLYRDRPPVVFGQPQAASLATFPRVKEFLALHYRIAAEIGPPDDRVRVLTRNDLVPLKQSAAGVPCYGDAASESREAESGSVPDSKVKVHSSLVGQSPR